MTATADALVPLRAALDAVVLDAGAAQSEALAAELKKAPSLSEAEVDIGVQAFVSVSEGADAPGGASLRDAVMNILVRRDTLTHELIAQLSPDAELASAGGMAVIDTGGAALGAAATQASLALDAGPARLALRRDAGAIRFRSTGGARTAPRGRVWLEGFGALGIQRKNTGKGLAGHSFGAYGVSLGVDRLISGSTSGAGVAGVALSYAKSDVKSKGAGRAVSDITSYMATLYGEYRLGDGVRVDGQLGYAHNTIASKRLITALDATPSAKYSSNLFMASAGVGRSFDLGQGLQVTPRLGARFAHVSSDGYTEDGGALGATVSSADVSSLQVSVGARVEKPFETGQGVFTPFASVAYAPELMGKAYATTGVFNGGGASFAIKGAKPSTHNAEYSLGFTLTGGDLDVITSYDGRLKAGALQHGGRIKLRWEF